MLLTNFNEMWWLIGSAPDFWGRDPAFEFGISHKDPDALQDHCEIKQKISELRGKATPEAKKDGKNVLKNNLKRNLPNLPEGKQFFSRVYVVAGIL